jgi:spore coat protein A
MITRLNVYAGLAGLYIVRDDTERQLGLPVGPPYEIPLVLQGRSLEQSGDAYTGRLLYDSLTDFSTFFGDFLFANGVLWPYLDVEPTQYRLRILNGSNGQGCRLNLVRPDGTVTNEEMTQIGVDSGFLPSPAPVDARGGLPLLPAERADVILDLRKHAGTPLSLADGDQPILQFRVRDGSPVTRINLPATLPSAPSLLGQAGSAPFRSIVLISDGHNHSLNGKRFHDPAEETPEVGAVEVWEFINTSKEAHPMHLHLVDFEVVGRERFVYEVSPQDFLTKVAAWAKLDPATRGRPPGITLTGERHPPDPHERGMKDTVRVPASNNQGGLLTRVIARFGPYTGTYMYHCHILEHEDMEMMRPFLVVPPGYHKMPGGDEGHHAHHMAGQPGNP